ncbi:MAG: tetratricopeptide repeat protein [Anaerolineae bacterium]|nr:MAG: tetratricopeptide repeat protein [Anaerolineae bacterium]
MYISRRRRKRRSILPFIIIGLLLIGAAYVINQSANLIELRNPLVPPEPTPTPARSALSYLAEAESLYANGQIPEAIGAYAGVAALEPDNDEALRWQARLHALLGHTAAAVTLAQKAVDIDPTEPRNLAVLAMALDWNKQYDDALKTALNALDLDATLPEAHAYLAEIYMDKGIWALALEEAQTAVKLDENSVEAWRTLGYVLDQQGRRDEALQAYDRAIALHPKLGYLYIGKGYVYLAGAITRRRWPSSSGQSTSTPTAPTATTPWAGVTCWPARPTGQF